jgi:hypothetical protein
MYYKQIISVVSSGISYYILDGFYDTYFIPRLLSLLPISLVTDMNQKELSSVA